MRSSGLLEHDRANVLEQRIQKVSLIVSLVALGFMVFGYAASMIGHGVSFPGTAATPFASFLEPAPQRVGLRLMSAGIVLLSLLPALRVVLALWLYVGKKCASDAAAALMVLLELIMSIHFGG